MTHGLLQEQSVDTVVQKLSDLHRLAAKLAGFEGQWGKIIKSQFE